MLKVLAKGWTALTTLAVAALAGLMVSGSVASVSGPVIEFQVEELQRVYWHVILDYGGPAVPGPVAGEVEINGEGEGFGALAARAASRAVAEAGTAWRAAEALLARGCFSDAVAVGSASVRIFDNTVDLAVIILVVEGAGQPGVYVVYSNTETARLAAGELGASGYGTRLGDVFGGDDRLLDALRLATTGSYPEVSLSMYAIVDDVMIVVYLDSDPNLDMLSRAVEAVWGEVAGGKSPLGQGLGFSVGSALLRVNFDCVPEMARDGDLRDDLGGPVEVEPGRYVFLRPNPEMELATVGGEAAAFTSFAAIASFAAGLLVVLPTLSRVSVGGEARVVALLRTRGADLRPLRIRMLAVLLTAAAAGGLVGYAAGLAGAQAYMPRVAFEALVGIAVDKYALAGLAVTAAIVALATWRPWSTMLSGMSPLESLRDPSTLITRPPSPSRAAWAAAALALYNIGRSAVGWSAIREIQVGDYTGFAAAVIGFLAFLELFTAPLTPVLAAYAAASILPRYSERLIAGVYSRLARGGRGELPARGTARYSLPLLAGVIAVTVFAFALVSTAGAIVGSFEGALERGVELSVGSDYTYYYVVPGNRTLAEVLSIARGLEEACGSCAAGVLVKDVVAARVIAGVAPATPLVEPAPVEPAVTPAVEFVDGLIVWLAVFPEPGRLAEALADPPKPVRGGPEDLDSIARALEAGAVVVGVRILEDVTLGPWRSVLDAGTLDASLEAQAGAGFTLVIDDAEVAGFYSPWPGMGFIDSRALIVAGPAALDVDPELVYIVSPSVIVHSPTPLDPRIVPEELLAVANYSVEEILSSEDAERTLRLIMTLSGASSMAVASLVLFGMVLVASVLVAVASVRLLEPVLASLRLRGARPLDAVKAVMTPWLAAVAVSLAIGVAAGYASGGLYVLFYSEAFGRLPASLMGLSILLPSNYPLSMDPFYAALIAVAAAAATAIPAVRLYQLYRGPPARWLRVL